MTELRYWLEASTNQELFAILSLVIAAVTLLVCWLVYTAERRRHYQTSRNFYMFVERTSEQLAMIAGKTKHRGDQ